MFRSLPLALVWIILLACRGPLLPEPLPVPPELWFDDLQEPALALDQGDATRLLQRVHGALDGRMVEAALPAHLAADTAPRALFVSVSDGSGPAAVALGMGQGIAAALDQAITRLDARARGSGPAQTRWIALDVVTRVDPRAEVARGGDVDFLFGLDGVAFDAQVGLAFPAREIVGRRLISRTGELRPERMIARARGRGLGHVQAVFDQSESLGVRTFETRTFFFESTTKTVRELFRGHTLERPVSDRQLDHAITAGAEYLSRAVDARGRFAYSYLAKQGEVEDDYNMVRHAGTIFAMVEVWDRSRDPVLGAAIDRAIGYMLAHIEAHGPAQADKGQAVSALAFNGKVKLGGVALAALALTTHVQASGSEKHLESARRLCRYLVAQQRPDGSFLHQRSHPDGEPLPFVSEYYPGEAILALVTLHQHDPDPRWLDAARKGARYLIQVRDHGLETRQLTHDHWLLYGLERLYRVDRDPLFLEHAMRIAEAIVGAQIRAGPGPGTDHDVAPDQIGGYAVPPRSTPIATRNEGLMAAYALARASGRSDMAARILDAVELGNQVVIAMQIDPARALYLEDPARALGGVTRTHDHFGVRIDYVQHSLSSWLALAAARRAKAPGPEPSRGDPTGLAPGPEPSRGDPTGLAPGPEPSRGP